MEKIESGGKSGAFGRILKGFLAVFGLALAITACSYVKSGMTFFKEGKSVPLSSLASYYSNGDGATWVQLDAAKMTADVAAKDFSASSMPFTYVDGCLAISSPEGSKQDCTMQVIDASSVYWAARNAFMVA